MASVQLSKADSRVLSQVFDPESASGVTEVNVDPTLPADRHISSNVLAELKKKERIAIELVENHEQTASLPCSKELVYQAALDILDEIIRTYPRYASARNNRAQLRRWQFGDCKLLCQGRNEINSERTMAGLAVIEDLERCIALTSPRRPGDGVSPAQGRLLAQSYTQLAALYYAAFRDLNSSDVIEIAQLTSTPRSKLEFEEEASRLFHLGGLYGNEVAKALAVHTNPHAKLCGSIVKEAMRKELAGM